jgi:inner membrane protein
VPTIFTHPLVALARTWFPRVSGTAVVLGAVGTILPDADVVSFALGIPYEHVLGHRGLSHSILFALLYALLATAIARPNIPTFSFIFLCTISHAVLDAFTDGGLGVAFFAPFSDERYFFPFTPIRVSPIGAGFFSPRGMETLRNELLWVWAPCVAIALLGKHFVHVERKPRKKR